MLLSESSIAAHETLLSIVIPMYNEEACANETLSAVYEELGPLNSTTEVIAVDDGSTDGTHRAILRAAGVQDNLKLIRHEMNKGKAEALQSGVGKSAGRYVAFLDADLQYSPGDLVKMLRYAQTQPCDVVTGIRDSGRYHRERLIISRTYNGMMRLIFGVSVTDCNAGIKLMRREVAKDPDLFKYGLPLLIPYLHSKRFRVDAFSVALANHENRQSNFFAEDRAFGGSQTLRNVVNGIRGLLSLLLDLPLIRSRTSAPSG